MTPLRTMTRGTVLAALALATLGAGSAAADTTVVPDPDRPERHRLRHDRRLVAPSRRRLPPRRRPRRDGRRRAGAGLLASPTTPISARPSSNGRAIVYARGGDIYRYDVGAAAEQKLTAVSSSANEIAPSFFKDRIVFSRTNGKSPGTYILRPKRKLTRLFKTIALETDVAETRVIGRYGEGRQVDHPHPQHERRRREDRRPREGRPARHEPDAHALQRHLAARRRDVGDRRGGRRQRPPRPRAPCRRPHAAGQGDLAGQLRIPTLYTNATGVQKIAPKLKFS